MSARQPSSTRGTTAGEKPTLPDVFAAELSADVTKPLFPLPVGATWVYENSTDEGVGAGRGDGHVTAAPQRRVSAARPSGQGLASAAASPHATAKARMNFIWVVLVAFPGFPAIRLT